MEFKTVFIAHPLRGDIAKNIRRVRAICKELHSDTLIPYAPYLATAQYLNDNISEERELGMEANHEMFIRGFIDELWLYGDRISNGMAIETRLALRLNIPVIPKTKWTARDLESLVVQFESKELTRYR